MQIIENLQVKEKLYTEKLENGLNIMIIPKKGIKKKYVMWATHYGSMDNKFVVPGEDKETEVPDGVAHFLEHKMFEQPLMWTSRSLLIRMVSTISRSVSSDL